jgi:CheY-like chemotaxis protein
MLSPVASHMTSAVRHDHVKVLLAEASDDLRQVMKQAASTALPGARIIETKSGAEALALARTDKCDVVIIDVAMPLMSGAEVMGKLRAEGHRPFLVLTSAVVMPNWAMLSTELHAYEFMKKPFMAQDLQSLLDNYAAMQTPTRLLIADANDQTRAMVRKVISASRFAFDMQETENGGHALKLARMQPFDLALIDAHLAGMSGLETACQLQSLNPEMTVVSILPSNDGGLAQSLKHLGLQHSLRKPFYTRDIDMLMHGVRKLRRPYLMNAVLKATQTALAG